MGDFKLSSIEDAIKDFKDGHFVIVVDDEDRENEGDLIIAAEKIDAEKVNFMLKNARGVLCAPITLSRCDELDLPHQVSDNTSMLGTPFTVTVDKLEGCSTGVSAHDRAETILCTGQRCIEKKRPHRGCHRPLQDGRTLSSRRTHGNHERRRHHGTPARTDEDGEGMEPQGNLHQRHD